jgi:hypothetical protein
METWPIHIEKYPVSQSGVFDPPHTPSFFLEFRDFWRIFLFFQNGKKIWVGGSVEREIKFPYVTLLRMHRVPVFLRLYSVPATSYIYEYTSYNADANILWMHIVSVIIHAMFVIRIYYTKISWKLDESYWLRNFHNYTRLPPSEKGGGSTLYNVLDLSNSPHWLFTGGSVLSGSASCSVLMSEGDSPDHCRSMRQ